MQTKLWTTVACIAVMVIGLSATFSRAGDGDNAKDANAKDSAAGTVSGVVLKDGKPLANARVGIMPIPSKAERKANRKGGGGGDNAAPATQPADNAGKGAGRREPVAKTQTDADGKFSLDGLKPGEYVVVAGVKGEGRGRKRISVAANQDTAVQIDVQATDPNQAGADQGKAGREHKHARKLGL
jgi:hypothetical protein